MTPQDANDTAPVATGSRQPDSCDATFTVVASVNQWGSLAQQLGGPCATVTSLINSTSADPHDYEPTPADLAKLSRADISASLFTAFVYAAGVLSTAPMYSSRWLMIDSVAT